MSKWMRIVNSKKGFRLLLLLSSLTIYSLYFYYPMFHPNSVLSSITGDSIKNYFTFLYHIKNDAGPLHFAGMNYPYGEHAVYTDCQPLLTWLLRAVPFAHDHLVGIQHLLLFGSFVFAPLVLFRVLLRLQCGRLPSFFGSLAIAVLSPLYFKVFWGHFALAYGVVVPVAVLLLLRYQQSPSKGNIAMLLFYNSALFFIHPYTGFGTSLFSFLSCGLYALLRRREGRFISFSVNAVVCGLLPVILFRVFMVLSDNHSWRSEEPSNEGALVANMGCLLVPAFGPYAGALAALFHTSPSNYEGFCYLGIATILVSLLFLPFFFFRRRISYMRQFLPLIFASLVLLLLSFGYLGKLLSYFNLHSGDLRQFRAIARLDIYFYYCLPLFVFPLALRLLREWMPVSQRRIVFVFSLLFFAANMTEAHFLFSHDRHVLWNNRNFFSASNLNEEEIGNLRLIDSLKPQAIMTLPLYLSGSEVLDRDNWNLSMIASMLYSYHTGLPVVSSYMSRTPVRETMDVLSLYNPYKRKQPASRLLNGRCFLVLRTTAPLLPDEERLAARSKFLLHRDSLSLGYIGKEELFSWQTAEAFRISRQPAREKDFIYEPFAERKPFKKSHMNDYEVLQIIDSNAIAPGRYAVSFHYYYSALTHRGLSCNLIITRISAAKGYDWFFNDGVRRCSGSYPGRIVYENFMEIEPGTRYEFLLKGTEDLTYRVSDFMLRPVQRDVVVTSGTDTLVNNFPISGL